MNLPTQAETRTMRTRYSVPRKIESWVVIHCGKVVYESIFPALCETHIKQFNLVGAVKRAVYGKV